jgi:hypothetical protein
MSLIDTKTDKELILSLVGEIAKAKNEINCAQGDIDQAKKRLNFLIVVVNEL